MVAPTSTAVRRADLHCHSIASNEADEAVLNAINCPESYSDPIEVYEQAKRRGMDFVTITDHDSIEGVAQLSGHPEVLIGEEVTCYFPEDRCKIHLLVWGLSKADHDAMQAVANDIYQVAAYVEEHNLAHSVAHPVYRQNDVLELWHLERLALMFKGFECLNGAHSALHREALEPFVDALTEERIAQLSRRHGMKPRWPQPWIKARTAGSDDHGLFNIGRTWTEFPANTTTVPALLQCIREARCQPGGEAGSSMKLAHNFFSVGIRYYARQIAVPNSAPATLLGLLTGERQPRWKIAAAMLKGWTAGFRRKIGRIITGNKHPEGGTALLGDVLSASFRNRLRQAPILSSAIKSGAAPLAQHAAMFDLVSAVNRDVAEGIRAAVAHAMKDGQLAPVFDVISAIAAHQFMMAPYYFALFHQNRERQVLDRVTGHARPRDRRAMRLGVFTDVFEAGIGTSRFARGLLDQAVQQGAAMTVHTCTAAPGAEIPSRRNFAPLMSLPMPFYGSASLHFPPVLEILEWADRQQFDAIHVHTAGPMGLCGWLVAKMLRVPLIATFNMDLPAYVNGLTGDYRMTTAASGCMQWFYNQANAVFCRSRSSLKTLEKLGVESSKLTLMPPSVDGEQFSPAHRNADIWRLLGVRQPHKILYAGRVSVEKNLPLLTEAFEQLCACRHDVALIIAGDGPYLPQMRKALAGLPVYFPGAQHDASLRTLYASSDLFVFPSGTDTMGQSVMEAQASGLPVLVGNEGGPREMMDDGLTGLVLPAKDAAAWSRAMYELLEDGPCRLRMSRTASTRMARFAPAHAFEVFWNLHLEVAARAAEKEGGKATSVTTVPAEWVGAR
jgi:glycosyltransferase involved in cell wall biosynthesis